MNSVLWALADALDIVPTPPDARVAAMLTGWWSRPRLIGCAALRKDSTAPWFVCAPDPTVLCGACAAERHKTERRCMFCHAEVAPTDEVAVIHEMKNATVVVLGRTHQTCQEEK
ncbi:hypothetical protein KVF89_16330 [Nocardioides carbamazepini]|uniref:hypothetical protein n=1 Tax=Nocardioides carbamazepini TaxID=2854259 RepID=UPI00214A6268|nr:hypothetical protein [Nocardioides carbamazepini]MCR1784108.1 hypothetical protein [Nocardioides carbamazepini]